MSLNPILVTGFGPVSGVREAQRLAENAKEMNASAAFAACSVVLNEALKESENIIKQLFVKANDFDKQMKVMQMEVQRLRKRKALTN